MTTEKIVIKKQEENVYKVTYTGFGGAVFVSKSKGEIVDVQFKGSTSRPVSAQSLRDFPLNAVEILLRNRENSSPSTNRPKLARPESLDDNFMKKLSEYYLDSLSRNERPLVSIEEATRAPRNTVARWVANARKRGFLQ